MEKSDFLQKQKVCLEKIREIFKVTEPLVFEACLLEVLVKIHKRKVTQEQLIEFIKFSWNRNA